MQMANQNHFIELIKELASANNKLKLDLLDCSDLLVESRAEVSRLYLKLEELQQTDESHPEELHPLKHLPTHPHLPAKINNYPKQQHQGEWLSSSAPQTTDGLPVLPRIVTSFPVAIKTTMDDTDKKTALSESPESSPVLSSPTIVHHHYHYYLRNKLLSEKRKNDSQRRLSDTPCPDNELYRDCNISAPNVTLSSSTSSRSLSDHRADITSPFSQLRSTVTIALQRLQKTDIRALNRRLKKAFDMLELTSMSNSIIESIVSDLEHLKMQFSWMEDKTLVRDEVWANDISMMEFFPLLHLVQEMLREIGQLRTTMNDLQVEYVKKVEESDIRLEEELLKKERQEIAQRKSNAKTSPFSWITNVFQRSHNSKEVTFNHETSYSVIHSSPSSSNMTSIVTRTKKIEVDRYGPISSFPTRSPAIAIGGEKKRRSMTQTVQSISTTTHMKAYPILRASQSAGTVRRSKSMQPSALDYVVRRKRSTLGLSTTTPVDFDHVISPQPTPPEIAGTFSTSWLGNK
ncbi:hypothetical protein BDB01DRAFT_287434 [Pilobolus umbonatus]|nr:hypothetical protein BDB01DRAFT_287434 [Pilobolus umbonatus]